MANTQDLGSCGLKNPSEFDSRYSHQLVRSERSIQFSKNNASVVELVYTWVSSTHSLGIQSSYLNRDRCLNRLIENFAGHLPLSARRDQSESMSYI